MVLPKALWLPCEVVRAVAFMVITLCLSCSLTVFEVIFFPVVYVLDPTRWLYHQLLFLVARVSMWPFFKVELRGMENFPEGGCVLACNHQSLLDAYILSHITSPHYKSTFKRELLFYPGVGTVMACAGHLWVRRGDRTSGQRLMRRSEANVKRGVSMLFFPEGTRKIDPAQGLGDFKAGAFKVATATNAPIVPMTISGARTLMPPKGLPRLGWGTPVVTIHKPIQAAGKEISELMEEVRESITSGLRDIDRQ